MESLTLKKFKDAELSETQLVNCFGGASSKTEHCTYSSGRFVTDHQTDFYSDNCEDGNYTYVDSCVQREFVDPVGENVVLPGC